MTDDTMGVQTLLGKSADADFLRAMIGFAAQRLMDLEVGSLTGAGYGEKSSDRLTQRNPVLSLSKGAIAIGTGRRGLARWSCASPACGPAAISRHSLSLDAWPRRL